MIGKNIKISKGFKNFLTQILHKEETYENTILKLIRLNNPKLYKNFLNFKNGKTT